MKMNATKHEGKYEFIQTNIANCGC